jgi:hypothetical protein
MTTTPTFRTKTEWKQTYSRRRNGFIRAAHPYITTSAHEAPLHIRRPYSASEWIALPETERVEHVKQVAHEFVLDKIGPAPEPRRQTITLADLERRVIAEAEQKCDDLRFILSGDPDDVEARVNEQRPRFRAEVFDRLTKKYKVLAS